MKLVYVDAITCVRWDPSGKSIASTSWDKTVKVLDFASGKVTYYWTNCG